VYIILTDSLHSGSYHTDEMIISVYESQKREERDKLMQFVEEAAYSSDEEDTARSKSKRSHSSTAVSIACDPRVGLQLLLVSFTSLSILFSAKVFLSVVSFILCD